MSETTPDTALEANLLNRVTLGDTSHRNARRFSARVALVNSARHMTYGKFNTNSNRYARTLLANSLKPGDEVVMAHGNSVQLLVTAYGVLKVKLVRVSISAMFGSGDVCYILEHAETRHVMIDAVLYPALCNTLAALGLPAHQCFGKPVADGPQPAE